MVAERERLAGLAPGKEALKLARKEAAATRKLIKRAKKALEEQGHVVRDETPKPALKVGGWQRGEKHHNAKLKDGQRRKIITLWFRGGVSQRVLAEKFGVNQSTIGHVIRNNQWVMSA